MPIISLGMSNIERGQIDKIIGGLRRKCTFVPQDTTIK